jgi:UPF0755 protein
MMMKQQFYPGKKTVGVLSGVILSSVVAFYLLILFWPQGNPYERVNVDIPKGSSLAEISAQLRKKHIIRNEKAFLMAVKTLGHERNIPAGAYTLQAARTNFGIIQQLVNGSPRLIKVTILEGWKMTDIARHLEAQLGTDSETILALKHDSQLLEDWNIPSESLEGFLFPNTYYFQKEQAPRELLSAMLQEYRQTMTPALLNRAQELGLSELEVVTLASIIEGEAIHDEERPIISAVYHNRLKRGMRLQADPTIQYLINDGPRRLLKQDLKIDSPYNTYLHYGLPPGPINNPGLQSILAALYPADNDYLYFVARGDGYHTFSRTEADHLKAKRAFQKVRRDVRRKQRLNKTKAG